MPPASDGKDAFAGWQQTTPSPVNSRNCVACPRRQSWTSPGRRFLVKNPSLSSLFHSDGNARQRGGAPSRYRGCSWRIVDRDTEVELTSAFASAPSRCEIADCVGLELFFSTACRHPFPAVSKSHGAAGIDAMTIELDAGLSAEGHRGNHTAASTCVAGT
jgi:hypothetical protein